MVITRHPSPSVATTPSDPIAVEAMPAPALVPMGPPWWGAVMGTGILATLTQLHIGTSTPGAVLARCLLVAGWLLMVSFATLFLLRVRRSAQVWRDSVSGVGSSAWGMVAMGILAVGSATGTVMPAWSPTLASAAWTADRTLWVIGTLIGFLSTFGFAVGLLRHRPKEPRPAWGLAIVPPMVSATSGAPFVAQISSPLLSLGLLAFLVACFVCSLTLGIVIFTAAYHHHLRIEPIPVPLSISAWIPLGVVGQSTAAAQAIAAQSGRFLTPESVPAAQAVADGYGYLMLSIAVPLVLLAISVTLHGVRNGMPFSPGWWALTFPIGTLSLGALNLSKGSHLAGYSIASTLAWIVLLGTWTLCVIASLRPLVLQQAARTRRLHA
ncbi:TDT family transporter [Acidipropionibacterium jensenii]|uniref:TDT family transporter n=1 Tax=Acidipropionibacterium jensenii TaxID=1749 RepID=UPI000BC2CB95|nr:TDT family transporter [Acidipropionibacterium jensenii]